MLPVEAQVHGGGVDPQGQLASGPRGTQPKLLATDAQVAAGRHDPVDFQRIDAQRLAVRRHRLLDYRSTGCRDRVRGWRPGIVGFVVEGIQVVNTLAAGTGGGQFGWTPQSKHSALLDREGGEALGGGGHVQGLVRAGRVVLDAPGIHRGLRGLQTVERAVRIKQFNLDRLMPAFHFPRRGGRSRFGQPLRDAVMATDPLKQHLRRTRPPKATGELATIVAEHFVGHPVLGH